MKNNLLKSLLLFVFTILGTTSSWALTANLSMDYELAGWKAKTFYDFTANADGVLPTEGDLRYRADYGLYNFGSGSRSGDVAIEVAEGDLLICQFADTQNRGVTINSISCCTKNTELSDKAGHIFFDVNTAANTITFNVGRAGSVVSMLIMEKDENATIADYTLNYLLDETPVKSVTGTMAVGGLLLTDASFFADDVKYFRADGEAESFTIAASGNTFIVNVRLASTYNYTLQSNLGATLATGTDFEGEAPRVGYPRYQFVDGKLYEAPVDNKEFRKTVNLTEDNVSVIVNYTEKEGANAVFYVEGENVEGMTVSETGNIPVRASYALAGAATEDVTITSLPAGKYKLHVGIFASKSAYQEKVVNFGIGNEIFAAAFTGVNLNEVASDEYTLTTSTDIKYIAEGTWTDAQFDYIWIEKTGEAEIDPAIAAAQEALQTAIAIASNINPEGLADAIATAQAALTAEDATAESLAQAAQTLEAAIKTYFGQVLPNLGAIVTALNEDTLNTAYADALAALANEDVTPQELAAAMQQIIVAAQAVAPEHLQNLKGYAVKYGAEDAASLITLIDNALAAIEAGNVSQIITTMTAVKTAATPLAETVLSTMISYVQAFGLTEQAAQAQAALESDNYITMITTAKALFTHLIAAAQDYLPKLGAIAEGLNDSTLNVAYAAAEELLAKESITPEELGAAMQNIIVAAQAVAPEHLQNLREYAVKYGAADAVDKVDAALAAIQAGNVSQIIATMTAVKEAATPLATSILTQIIEDALNYDELADDVTAAQAALAGGNYITMIITAKDLYAKLMALLPAEVSLTDGEAITALSEYVGKEVNVTYTRQFTEGKISTVCLPFAYEKKEGDGSFYGFTNIEWEGGEYVATMTEPRSTTLEASIPYLYLPNATGEVDFSGTYTIPAELKADSTTNNGWTFKGTFETIEWAAAPEGIYGFAAQDQDGIYQGQFVKVGKYVRIKPMRCYLENKYFAGARGAKRASENLPDTIKVRLVGADGEVTAIGTISTKTGEVTLDKDAWYTLDGRRVMNPTNGLYIRNGKKVVIK